MFHINPRLYVAVILVVLLVPGLPRDLWNMSQTDQVLSSADKQDYLASLHNASLPGCLNLQRFQPEIVFVGDSHAYAAIDYLEAGELLGIDKVGQCALAGAYLPSFALFLDWLAQSPYRPKRLILITSPRQFVKTGDVAKRLDQHRTLLFDENYQNKAIAKWLKDTQQGKPPFGRLAKTERAKRQLQEKAMDRLDEVRVTEFLEHSKPPHLEKWRKVVPTWITAPRAELEVQSFCARVRRLGIKLDVVHAPESPISEEIYSQKQWSDYLQILGGVDCASSVYILTSKKAGLGNRHFSNRWAKTGFDYNLFLKSVAETDKFDSAQWHQLFDMDHPNRAAARKITRKIIFNLKEQN